MSESKPSSPQVEVSGHEMTPLETPAAAENPSGQQSGRRLVTALAIVAVAAAFVTLTGIIYYKWWKAPPQPTAMIVVEGDAELGELELTLIGGPDGKIRQAKLDAARGYVGILRVPAGEYTLVVSYDGHEVQKNIRLGSWQVARVPLGKRPS